MTLYAEWSYVIIVLGVCAFVTSVAIAVGCSSPTSFIGYQSCHRWVTDCAQHKSLAECQMDARQLGCSEGSIP